MQNIFESLAGWIIGVLIGCLDKISVLSIFAFSPQLLILRNLFPGADSIYSTFIYISICIAIVILLFKIIINIFTPSSKEYEPYSVLFINFVRYCIVMMILPVIISFFLNFSNTVYWGMAEQIYPEVTDTHAGIEGCFEGIYSALVAQFSDDATVDFDEEEEEAEEPQTFLGSLRDMAGAGAGFILGIMEVPLRITGHNMVADSIESLREKVDPNYRVHVNGGTVAAVLSAFLTIYLGWNYLMFMLEAAERYIVMSILILCMPLSLAPSVSKSSESITKRYFSMFISQLIILVFTAIFLAMFQYAAKHLPTTYIDIASTSGTVQRVGGLFLYLLLLSGFLKVGCEIDRYLGTLGLSAAQTGRNLGGEVYAAFRTVGSLANGAVNAVKGAAGLAGKTGTTGVNMSSGDTARQAAVQTTISSIQNAAAGGADGRSGGVDALHLNKESIGAEGMQEALRAAADNGISSVGGNFAQDYADGMLKGNGMIPEDAKINGAELSIDKDGNLKAADIRYTDRDGNVRNASITDQEPESGVFLPFSDELGNSYYATATGDPEAVRACDEAFSNGQKLEGGYAVDAGGNVMDKDGNAILSRDYPDTAAFEAAKLEKGRQLTESDNTVPFDTGAEAYLPGADIDALKSQYGVGDDARVSVCRDQDGNFHSFNLYDGMGNQVATVIHRTENVSEAAKAADSDSGIVTPAGEGGFVVGSMNPVRTKEYDQSRVTLPDGSVITGETFDFDRTSVNGHMPKWRMEHPDGKVETMGPVKAERLCNQDGAIFTPGAAMQADPDSDHTVTGKNVLYRDRNGNEKSITNEEADRRAQIYSGGTDTYGKYQSHYEKPEGSITGAEVKAGYRELADTGYRLNGTAFESAVYAKYGNILSGQKFTVIGRSSECRFNEAVNGRDSERYTDMFVRFEGMDSAQKITISNDPKSGGKQFKGMDGGTYYWRAGATQGKGRPVGNKDKSSGRWNRNGERKRRK